MVARWRWASSVKTRLRFLTSLTRATSTYTCFHSHLSFVDSHHLSDQTLVLPPTRRYCLLTPRLYHDLVLRLLHPSAIPTLPITCVCRCGYYYYVRCRLIFRSRALSVVYGTALAPASTSFSCLSFHLFFHELSFGYLSYTLKYFHPSYILNHHRYSPPPQVRHGPQTFSFFFFVSVRSTISTLSLSLLQYTHYYTRAFSPATTKEKSVLLICEGDEPSLFFSLSLIRSYYQLANNCGGQTDISFLHVHIGRFRIRTQGWYRVSYAICSWMHVCIRGFLVVPIGA